MKRMIFSVAAPVYDQDTTQVAEYDGGTYVYRDDFHYS